MSNLELNSIGNKIRILRKKKNLSQLEFAQKIGCAQNTVAEWEKRDGRIPGRKFLLKVASTLEVSVDYLMGKEKENEYKIPCYGEINSGGFSWKQEKISYYIEVCSSIYQTNMFALKITDDALEPLIPKGDYGIFTKSIAKDGDVLVVRFPSKQDMAIVKRLRKSKRNWMLSEINIKTIHQPYFFDIESVNDTEIIFSSNKKLDKVCIEGKLVVVKKDPGSVKEELGIKYIS